MADKRLRAGGVQEIPRAHSLRDANQPLRQRLQHHRHRLPRPNRQNLEPQLPKGLDNFGGPQECSQLRGVSERRKALLAFGGRRQDHPRLGLPNQTDGLHAGPPHGQRSRLALPPLVAHPVFGQRRLQGQGLVHQRLLPLPPGSGLQSGNPLVLLGQKQPTSSRLRYGHSRH